MVQQLNGGVVCLQVLWGPCEENDWAPDEVTWEPEDELEGNATIAKNKYWELQET